MNKGISGRTDRNFFVIYRKKIGTECIIIEEINPLRRAFSFISAQVSVADTKNSSFQTG